MALTLADFQTTFKKFGKIIYMSTIGAQMITDLRKAHMGLVDQAASGLAAEFDVNQDVVTNLGTNVKTITDSIGKLPSNTKAAATTLLTKYVAVDLGLAAQPSTAALQTALSTQMLAASGGAAKVAPSGIIWSYFNDNLGIQLPQAVNSGAATILESYVDDDVV